MDMWLPIDKRRIEFEKTRVPGRNGSSRRLRYGTLRRNLGT